MNDVAPTRILLGPQSPQRNIAEAMQGSAIPDGPMTVISAGWQETEGDLDELAELVQRPLVDLRLYRRAEKSLAANPTIADAARQRQHRLKEQQRLYRLRLKQLAIAARRVLSADGNEKALAAEQRHAFAQLRALDRHHLKRCEKIWAEFAKTHGPTVHDDLARQAAEIQALIGRSAGVIVTGGNIAIMVSRMRLFGVERMLGDCNLLVWSAGAMVLAERIVLFHELGPEGRRDAEIFGTGCGVLPGFVFLPDVRHRLKTDDRHLMRTMSRRFSPDTCIALDNGAALRFSGNTIDAADEVRRLTRKGRLAEVEPA